LHRVDPGAARLDQTDGALARVTIHNSQFTSANS
jgi:hypothetical protein